jgi:hypothetical protein
VSRNRSLRAKYCSAVRGISLRPFDSLKDVERRLGPRVPDVLLSLDFMPTKLTRDAWT